MAENRKTHDAARFGPDSSAEEISASIVCRTCLQTPETVVVVDGLHGVNAFCRCAECEPQTVVALTRLQLEHLKENPPAGIAFDFLP